MGIFNRIYEKLKSLQEVRTAVEHIKEPQKQPLEFKETVDKEAIQSTTPTEKNLIKNEQGIKLIELTEVMDTYLKEERYIARSEYSNELLSYKELIDFFISLDRSDMLSYYCEKNGLLLQKLRRTIEMFENYHTFIEKRNDEYIQKMMIEEKEYLDNILKEIDSNIDLDEEQRKVILTDEDYCLVIAGAGAGKTTTVAAKVKYLVERRKVNPSQILVVSYTNKAVNELKEKINGDLKIGCPIATFHSTGNAILHKKDESVKLNIVDNSKMFYVIRDYFRNSILANEHIVDKLIMFFACYFDAPYEGDNINNFFNQIAKANFTTMKSELEEFKKEVIDRRTKKSFTIQNEMLRSQQEVEIANFLYLNNIYYEYEPCYQYHIMFSRKPYTPDFLLKQGEKIVYLEHFGITEDGKNDRYSESEIEVYKKAVNDKVKLHRQHGTTLIYTFSKYNDGRSITEHLKEELEKQGFDIIPRSNKEVMETIIAGEENRYVRKLLNLICRFISNFKVNGYTSEDFNRMSNLTKNVRSKLFLDICHDSYLEYDKYLKENKAVDFEDLINESTRILREIKEMKQKLDFKYIIVDEYQDISRQRFDLTKAFSEVTNAKIIAVGDDWQSIYAFSGSDLSLFTKFSEKMGYAKLLKIVKTYRNSQEVIDIAGNFIQKNSSQITKKLISPKNITDAVIIYTYDSTSKKYNAHRKSGANYETAYAVEVALKQIIDYGHMESRKSESILLLGRFGFDGDQLEKTGLFEYIRGGNKIRSIKYPHLDITFMTAHSSKGLGYDEVIIINGKNETYGFPSKIEDDPVLNFVIKGDNSYDYSEERRLFYVAMTRTKNRVYIIAPQSNPSEFLLEIKRDYKNVVLKGNWTEEPPTSIGKKTCPICGYPLQLKFKEAYGLRLYICTNEPELCSFMTNEYKARKLSILKCERCKDGYLIAKCKKKDGEYFLGCTNYLISSKGCNHTISTKQYYDMMGYKDYDEVIERKVEKVTEVDEVDEARNQRMEDYKDRKKSPKDTFHKLIDVTDREKAKNSTDVHKKAINDTIKTANNDEIKTIGSVDKIQIYYKEYDLVKTLDSVLNGLVQVSIYRFYGIFVLIDVLRGSMSRKITQAKLDKVSEFGRLKEMKREELLAIIDWLIEQNYILRTKSKYPVLHPTAKGLRYKDNITPTELKNLKKHLEQEFRPYTK